MTEDGMVGWHHRLDGHEFEQAPGVGEGQGSLACSSPWGHKEQYMTEGLNYLYIYTYIQYGIFGGAPKSLQMVTAAMKLKDAYSLEEKL